MSFFSIFLHLLAFFLPALALALGLVLASRLIWSDLAKAAGWRGALAINFLVGGAVLAAGLVLTGADGRMATYAALVLACATSQWLWLRAWRA